MSIRIENITPRLSIKHIYCEEYNEQIILFDGNEIMGVCKTFYHPDTKPFYFEYSPTGWRDQISKADLMAKLETLKTA